MTQREFERALVKVCPTVYSVTYNRTFGKGKPFYNAIYVHWKTQEDVALCHLEQSNDFYVDSLKFFKEFADAPK
jgi:hypothetical protein